jgi:hypothetical protein
MLAGNAQQQREISANREFEPNVQGPKSKETPFLAVGFLSDFGFWSLNFDRPPPYR